ncbi:MAG: DUF1684 domain-containing protein [Anaerolineaceae bacterium]
MATVNALDEFRAAKDTFYQTSDDSPLLPEQKRVFQGLNYYSEAPALVFDVTPELFADPELIDMQTSTGDSARYLRWARLTFASAGERFELTVFRDPGSDSYFLPFQDSGRGEETYGAGRYLEVEPLDDGRLHVDFNYAYNPYCAYNDGWSCPLPPGENRLNVPIRAGEKTFHAGE